jgi:D-alanyl-D-alanine carboxypeptidase
MSKQYTARYGHGNDTPIEITLDATNDAEARTELRGIVSQGYRNSTWAACDLRDGSSYAVRNKHGRAVAAAAKS